MVFALKVINLGQVKIVTWQEQIRLAEDTLVLKGFQNINYNLVIIHLK